MGSAASLELEDKKRRIKFDWLNKVAEAHMLLDEPIKQEREPKVEKVSIPVWDLPITAFLDSKEKEEEADDVVNRKKEKEEGGVVSEDLDSFMQSGSEGIDGGQEEKEYDNVGYSYYRPDYPGAYVLVHSGPKTYTRKVSVNKNHRYVSSHQPYDYSVHQPLK